MTVDGNVYEPLLGRTWAEIGSEARAMHKCQGFGQLLALPGPFVVKYRLVDTTLAGQAQRDERRLTDGLDLSLPGLRPSSAVRPPARLTGACSEIAASVAAAEQRVARTRDPAPRWRRSPAGSPPPARCARGPAHQAAR